MPFDPQLVATKLPAQSERFAFLIEELRENARQENRLVDCNRVIADELESMQQETEKLAEEKKQFFQHDYRSALTTIAGLMGAMAVDFQGNAAVMAYVQMLDETVTKLIKNSETIIKGL